MTSLFSSPVAAILLDTAADAVGTESASKLSSYATILMLVAMVAIFYFFLYRPQKKQEKETAKMRSDLKVGDEITTIGGIIGKIVSIKDETVMIETGNEKTKIRILRSAVRCVDVHVEDIENSKK